VRVCVCVFMNHKVIACNHPKCLYCTDTVARLRVFGDIGLKLVRKSLWNICEKEQQDLQVLMCIRGKLKRSEVSA